MYLDTRFFLQRQDPPFNVDNNEIDLILNQDEELFEYLVKSPNYISFRVDESVIPLGDSDIIDLDAPNVASVAVILSEAQGKYPLGERLINGEDLEVPNIVTIKLNDVC